MRENLFMDSFEKLQSTILAAQEQALKENKKCGL